MKTSKLILISAFSIFNITTGNAQSDSYADDKPDRYAAYDEYYNSGAADSAAAHFRLHNKRHFGHALDVSTSYSLVTYRTNKLLSAYSDTNALRFNSDASIPALSIGQEFYFDRTFSIGYSAGYMTNSIYAGDELINSKHAFLFVRPKLNVYKCKWFEGYVQWNLGLVYNDLDLDHIPSEVIRRQLPANFKFYTGFTPLGINLRINDRIWSHFEYSLWSFETFKVGLKFKLNKNWEHPSFLAAE